MAIAPFAAARFSSTHRRQNRLLLDPPWRENDYRSRSSLAAARVHQRRVFWMVAATVGGLLTYLGLLCLLPEIFAVSERPGPLLATGIFGLVVAPLFLILFVGGIGGCWLLDRRTARNPRLRCPKCNQPLLKTGVASAGVIASRRCRLCNSLVLAEVQTQPDLPRLLSVVEFEAGYRRFRQGLLIVTACFGGVGIGLIAVLESWQRWCKTQFGETRAHTLALATAIVAVVLLFGAVGLAPYVLSQDSRVICPFCRRSMVEQWSMVVTTNRCGHCGQKVLVEPPKFIH